MAVALSSAAPSSLARTAAAAPAWPDQPRLHLFHPHDSLLDVAKEAKRRNIVVLDAADFALVAGLKAANPAIRVLVAKDLSSTRSDAPSVVNGNDAPLQPSGVGYVDADKNHPDWFALDTAGHRVQWAGQPGQWWMDTGNASYQQAWLARVAAELKDHHWDGVVLESALTALKPYLAAGRLQRYADDAALQRSTRSMLAAVGPALSKDGFDVIADIPNARKFPGLWKDWLSLVDGAAEQQFATFPNGNTQTYLTDDEFQQELDQVADAESAHHLSLNQAVGSSADRRARTYGLAAFLLVTDGSSTFAYGNATTAAYPPELKTAAKLGAPAGRYKLAGSRIYSRRFSRGLIVLNASRDQPAQVPTNHGVRTVRPASALILLDHGSSGGAPIWLAALGVLLIAADVRLVAQVARRNRQRLAVRRLGFNRLLPPGR